MNTAKPGVRTTEFWLSLVQGLAGPAIAVLIVAGVFSPEVNAAEMEQQLSANVSSALESVVAVIALWRSGSTTAAYTEARARVKGATG